MTLKFDRSFYWYTISLFLIISATLLSFGWFHWSKGTFDVERIGQFYESSYKLNELNQRKSLQKIDYYVSSDRVQEALHEESFFQQSVKKISRSVRSESNMLLEESLGSLKKSLRSLLTINEVFALFHILKKRVDSFQVFVVENNWRTLTRLSERLALQIDETKLRRPGFYKPFNIGPLVRSIDRNITLMKKVTTSSILPTEKKQLIMRRIAKMDVELKMLKKYSTLIKGYEQKFRSVQREYSKWNKDISPLFSVIELEKISNAKSLYLQGIAIAVGLVLLFAFSFVVFHFSQKRNGKMLEKLVLDQIQEGLIPLNGNFMLESSEHYKIEFQKLREYVHKRMSLGKLFQEAIPLSSLLLDSNLNIIWGNDLFYESWKLGKIRDRNEQVTWDYLLQYTNLGEQDPVIDALQNGIAGIYHIQLKLIEDRSIPYEMYVSPIEYLGEKRVMIMFYPLQSFEETIRNQSAAIVGPVNKTIDALMKAEFSNEFVSDIRKDFEIANIDNVLDSFIEFDEFNNSIKKELATEIKKYMKLYEDKSEQVQIGERILLEKQDSLQAMMDELKLMKGNFVSYISSKANYEDFYNELYDLQTSIGKEYESTIMQSEELNTVLVDTHSAFTNVLDLRSSFENIVVQIQDFRSDVLQLVDKNLLELKGHEITPVRQHELLLEIKNRVKKIDTIVYLYGKLTTKLDVALSKVQMIASGQEQLELSDLTQNITTFLTEVKNNRDQSKKFATTLQERELEVVQNLKSFFVLFKDILGMHKELKSLMKNDKNRDHLVASTESVQSQDVTQ